MVKETISTEKKILQAAKSVFHRKGFDGARMQEIADEAGINKALLHYYFRNKQTLFNAVFRDSLGEVMAKIYSSFQSEQDLSGKITDFYKHHIQFLQDNSFVPWFILNGLHECPEDLKKIMMSGIVDPKVFLAEFGKQMKEENITGEDPHQVFVNILALSVFPFVARPLLQSMFGFSDKEMDRFLNDRKKSLPVFINNALQGYRESSKP
jgi:TetR/AcrR family transcriptional regulator